MTATLPTDGPHWRQAPTPPEPTPALPRGSVVTAALVIAPALWATGTEGPGRGAITAAIGAGAALLGWQRPAGDSVGRWLLALVAGLLVGVVAGPACGAAAAGALLLAGWVRLGTPPIAGLPDAGPGAGPPAAVLGLVGAWAAAHGGPTWRILLPLALACTAPVWSRVGGGAVERLAARVAHAVGVAVTAVVFVMLGLVTVVVPWVLQRLLRWDPLPSRRHWVRRARRSAQAARPWRHEVDLTPAPIWPRVRVAVFSLIVLGLIAWSVPAVRETVQQAVSGTRVARVPFRLGQYLDDTLQPHQVRDAVPEDLEAYTPDPNGPMAAMADSAWFNESNAYSTAQGWALQPQAAWRPINPYRLLDFRSEVLNVVDGRRVTWTPPACECRRLRVWVYGGSTTYGLNQRDEHTIASYLSKVAAEQGVTIDVDNRGANGQLHWMEAERFAWDLTMEEPPDMVVFYDGVNESWSSGALNYNATGDIKPMIDPTTQDQWRNAGRSAGPVPDGPDGSRLIGYPDDVNLPVEELATVTVQRYDRSRELSRAAAEAHGVEVRYLWQPSRFSRPLVMAEPHANGTNENRSRLMEQLMQAELPDDVIDVSDALRVTDEPLFTDDVHHNERGARLIAEAIWDRIGDDLTRLASDDRRVPDPTQEDQG